MDNMSLLNASAFSLPIVEDPDVADFGPALELMLQRGCVDWSDLPRESDYGHVEYKWKLGQHVHAKRIANLATQMAFRLQEGAGKAYYLLGVRDSGVADGVSRQDHNLTVRVLMEAARVSKSIFLLENLNKECRNGWSSAWRVIKSDSIEVKSRMDALHLFTPERTDVIHVKQEMPFIRASGRASTASSGSTCSPRTSRASSWSSQATECSSPSSEPQLEPETTAARAITKRERRAARTRTSSPMFVTTLINAQ